MQLLIVCVLALLVATAEAFHLPRISHLQQVRALGTALSAKAAPIPDNESPEEQRERLRTKARKMMFNENGVAYAPWISKQIDEDAIIDDLIRKEQGGKRKKQTSILDRGEIETAEGMKWRMSGNQVDLGWVTNTESNNIGYVVEKRPSYGGDFQEVASFNEVTSLASKGPQGGRYRYTDPSTAGGSWIYRVLDCDAAGEKNVLCQCFVEVQTDQENKSQALVAAGFGVFFLIAAAIGYSIDPPR